MELSDLERADEFISQIDFSMIDILVNNAGFGYSEMFCKSDLAIYEQMINIHINVPIKLIHSVLPYTIERNSGTIINISSDSAFLLIQRNSVYSGSKVFLKNFTESLKFELMETNIKVQVVCPGLTKTDFHNKMGMDISKKKNRGLIHWSTPDEVVNISMRDLSRNKVVCTQL